MTVRLRLARFGKTHRPFYRIVAIDSRRAREGLPVEYVGTYNPMPSRDGVKELRVKGERIKYWLAVGAQPSEPVARLLGLTGILPMPPIRYSPRKSVPKAELKAKEAEEKKAAEAKAAAAKAAASKPAAKAASPAAGAAAGAKKPADKKAFSTLAAEDLSSVVSSGSSAVLSSSILSPTLAFVPFGRHALLK